MKRQAALIILAFVICVCGGSIGSASVISPQYGGVLTLIEAQGPQMLSYVPMMGPQDHVAIFPAGERLVDTCREHRGVEPVLAENVNEDPEALTITWHIRKGIKFHDGSDLNAEVMRWNFQQVLDAHSLPYSSYLKKMTVVEDYTFNFFDIFTL